jgi:hypothetical protein
MTLGNFHSATGLPAFSTGLHRHSRPRASGEQRRAVTAGVPVPSTSGADEPQSCARPLKPVDAPQSSPGAGD